MASRWFRERVTRYGPPYATEYVVDRSLPPSRHEGGRMTFPEADGGTFGDILAAADASLTTRRTPRGAPR
ncbi:hypothetical protein [Streptomyces sp. WAC 01529]|uniref:hypothetical protein n=1 Tax=Streptomyces sp. WAC 01529 TaxID=2203205 RepID=UPI00320480D2